MTNHTLLTTAAAAVAISALAWIGPVYLPLIMLGPVLSGLAAGAAGIEPRVVALTWLTAGVLVGITDYAVNQEDVVFHAGVAVVTACLGLGSTMAGAVMRRRPQAG